MQELYTKYKSLLFTLAYQLTGSVTDAEDAVQDVFLKIYDVPPEKLAEPKAYLCKMVTNRCRDLLKSARRKREQYVGEWLPEPFLTSPDDSMESSVVRDDLLSYAMIVLLERLSPSERAVFVLREALGFDYQEIAGLVDKSEPNCRKLFSRARAKMGIAPEELVRTEAETAGSEWVQGFLAALKQGNLNGLMSMLSQEVELVTDGGGKASVIPRPIATKRRVAAFLLGPLRQIATRAGELAIELVQLNGQPGLILQTDDGVRSAVLFHVEGDAIRNFYVVRNPDKLAHIGA
ncbi:RNA polymerase sigma-70 factor [Paenibacillus sp. GCM10023250]|uniref:RNA polymerase sigma-70 factor n=1 Tax=Paenibacillus sp. GCM10023250 TaxID=3252648 RepID=UPI00360D7A17